MRAYLELLASRQPLTATSDRAADLAAQRAYLELLASPEPLPAAPTRTTRHEASRFPGDAAAAYLALLASDAPLTPADLLPPSATTAPRRVTPAHRVGPALLGERGRHAVLAAALVAGVGLAGAGAGVGVGVGVAAAASGATTGQATAGQTATDQTTAGRSTTGRTAGLAENDPTTGRPGVPVASQTSENLGEEITYDDPPIRPKGPPPARAFVKADRKPRPIPVPVPGMTVTTAAAWVNPLPEASVTSCFGPRWGRLHAGVDLAAPEGTRIRAASGGVVVAAGEEGGYGNAVLIDHGNGWLTHYGHMLQIDVKAGQRVRAAETIGLEGSTGHSTGPHLHFEVHRGTYKNPVEPTAWMEAHGVHIPGCHADTEPADRPADKHDGGHSDKHDDKHSDKHDDKHSNKHSDKHHDKHSGKHGGS